MKAAAKIYIAKTPSYGPTGEMYEMRGLLYEMT